MSSSSNAAKGEPMGNPLSDAEIEAKFMENVEFSGKISKTKGDKVLGFLKKMEELPDMWPIIGLPST